MANKRGLTVLLGAALLAAPALAYAQGSQAAGLNGADEPAVQPAADQPVQAQPAAPLPGDPDYVEPSQNARDQAQAQEQETIPISAPRYRRMHAARYPGSPNRLNPMRQFPGELPERDHYATPFDLQGIVIEDARQSEALPTSPGLPATPDPLNP